MKRLLPLLLLFWSALGPGLLAAPLRVSSFSTILTEIAEAVGGDEVTVTAHVKAGVDPHDFEPKPEDLRIVGEAELVLLSAKHLESYVGKLQQATGTHGHLVEVGDRFASLTMKDRTDKGEAIEDPHWWQSAANESKATGVIRDELTLLRPEAREGFAQRAGAFQARLAALQAWARVKVAELARDRRKLVTSHDAFQYFARENGFTIYAIEGVSSEDQPSSKKVGEIIAVIRTQGVKAIFPENIENPKVLTEITRETGVKIGPVLYADGLGEKDGDAATYDAMYRHNLTSIVEALK